MRQKTRSTFVVTDPTEILEALVGLKDVKVLHYERHGPNGVAYTNALHVAWWIGIGLCLLWFLVARHATTRHALERSRVAGNG